MLYFLETNYSLTANSVNTKTFSKYIMANLAPIVKLNKTIIRTKNIGTTEIAIANLNVDVNSISLILG